MNAVSSIAYTPWIALPAPRSQKPASRANATVAEIAAFQAVDGLRKVLSAIARSMTSLGNSANAYFAQLSATLALDRAAHSMAHAVGLSPRYSFPFTPFNNPFAAMAGFKPLTAANFTTAMMENSFAAMANAFSVMTSSFSMWGLAR